MTNNRIARGRIVNQSRARQPHMTGLEIMVQQVQMHGLRDWNIEDATTVSLLRARARDLRAIYVREGNHPSA